MATARRHLGAPDAPRDAIGTSSPQDRHPIGLLAARVFGKG
jgi:hypothetical protein